MLSISEPFRATEVALELVFEEERRGRGGAFIVDLQSFSPNCGEHNSIRRRPGGFRCHRRETDSAFGKSDSLLAHISTNNNFEKKHIEALEEDFVADVRSCEMRPYRSMFP